MSDNDASGSYDKPDTRFDHDSAYDHAPLAAGAAVKGKGSKASKWTGILVAIAGGIGVLGAIFGGGEFNCDGSRTRTMIADLFVQVPLNTDQATMTDLTAITEVGYDTETKTRSCTATLLDSAGVSHAVAWTTKDAGDTYDYEFEVKS